MKNKNLKANFFSLSILIYLVVVGVFLGKILYESIKTPTATGSSTIPALSKSKLERVNKELDSRKSLEYETSAIDLSEYEFGVTEPFR